MKISLTLFAKPTIALLLAVSLQAAAGNSDTLVTRYISMAIQGDLSGASRLFAEYTDYADPENAALLEQFNEQFLYEKGKVQGLNEAEFAGDVTRAYEAYWRSALLDGGAQEAQLQVLESELSNALSRHHFIMADGTAVYEALNQTLESRGIYFLASAAPPLRDLFLWREEESRTYSVQLTDRRLTLEVLFMDDFLLQGWKDYASLGLVTTTGWVEGGKLYCLGWAYDTDSENFEVSYLKHEARHLADLDQYPDMKSTELEYRAKLTELAFANASLKRILEDFTEKAAENPDSPHAMANWRIVRSVYREVYEEEFPDNFAGWGYVDPSKVNHIARDLLERNTLSQ